MKYPEIYTSYDVLQVLNSEPLLPVKPEEPKKPQKPINPGEYDSGGNRGCFALMVIGTIVLFCFIVSADVDNKFGLILLSIGLFFCSFFLFKTTTWDRESHLKQQQEYRENLAAYPEKLKIYESSLAKYKNNLTRYEARVKELTSPESLAKYRSKRINMYLQSRIKPMLKNMEGDEVVKKGASEEYFEDMLKANGFNLLYDTKIKVGSRFYYPDFLIECNGIYLDIEIDEPYAGNDGTPIHYVKKDYILEHSIDEERNNFFTRNGIEVIRFSEEQIFCQSEKCVTVIREYIESLLHGKMYIVSEHLSLTQQKWTYEDSIRMAYRRFRRTYVPAEYVANIDKEEQLSYQEILEEIRDKRENQNDYEDSLPF